MKIELLSKHRSSLMAIAMILIALYHSYFPIQAKAYSFFIATNGHIGVDFFVFLSSFGLYYAYKKEKNYWKFLKKRLIRILPFSIPVAFLLIPIEGISILEAIIHSLGLSCFCCSDLTFWFTSLILFLYVVTPFYLKLFNKSPLKVTAIGILIIIAMCIAVGYKFEFSYKFSRVAVFFLGFYFAYMNDNKRELSIFYKALLIVSALVGWILVYYLYHYKGNNVTYVLPFILIVPGGLILIAWVLDKFEFLKRPLSFIGQYTYQFHLIHPIVLELAYLHYGDLYIPNIGFDIWINVGAIVIAFILSVAYREIVDFVLKRISTAISH